MHERGAVQDQRSAEGRKDWKRPTDSAVSGNDEAGHGSQPMMSTASAGSPPLQNPQPQSP